MNFQILAKINNFVKNRLIELSGALLMLCAIFLLASIASYSPGDPNFIYTPENVEIKNFGGFYGSAIADFLLQSIGFIIFLFVFIEISFAFLTSTLSATALIGLFLGLRF